MKIEYENFIKDLNKNLILINKAKLSIKKKRYNSFFIVTPPRGASMFFQQILVSFTKIGYVSNLMASFWDYPELGAILQKKFLNYENLISNFKSKNGNTDGVFEPHEWGYFWRKWLDIPSRDCYYNTKSKIKWKKLNNKLITIKNILGLPTVFKTPYVNTYFKEFKKNIDSARYIFIFRSPYAVCNSICNARIKKFNNINKFYSSKPKKLIALENMNSPIEEVIAQVYFIIKEMLEFKSILSKRDYIILKYEDLFTSSNKIIEKMIKFTTNDFSLYSKKRKISKYPIESFSSNFKNKNKIIFFDKNFKKEFDFYYDKYFKNFEYDEI